VQLLDDPTCVTAVVRQISNVRTLVRLEETLNNHRRRSYSSSFLVL